jgi:redox-sensitive bicupin YhaK (pirin superfamily)
LKKIIHRADSRGHANFGWLDTFHSFSFFRYHNPERMNFGLLRVLNDDIVHPGRGFDTHPHDNMEIISIPLQGSLEHRDSEDNIEIISTNDVQVMSAGIGLTHSEYNHSENDKVNFLQIWILPEGKDMPPRYDQKTFAVSERKNQLQLVVSPPNKNGALWIDQKAYISRSDLDKKVGLKYETFRKDNGVYIFLIDGQIEIENETLKKRDAIGISGTNTFSIFAQEESEILFIEVPMAGK